jgi:sugar phosphate isomerase/epimerase
MGVPEATLDELFALSAEYNMDFVELRALEGSIDLPGYFATKPFTKSPSASRPPVRLVATNLKLIDATQAEIDEFLGCVDVAIMLGAPYVRVFGGGQWGDVVSRAQLMRAAQTIESCRGAIKTRPVPCEILIETHLAFSSSHVCLRLNELLDEPLGILWDSHHTWRNACESPAETWQLIGPLVRHMHFSDSRMRKAPQTGYDCVLPGAGEYPVQALRHLLEQAHYSHGVSLEWEKIWNPEMPDIREALPEFRRLLVDRSV